MIFGHDESIIMRTFTTGLPTSLKCKSEYEREEETYKMQNVQFYSITNL